MRTTGPGYTAPSPTAAGNARFIGDIVNANVIAENRSAAQVVPDDLKPGALGEPVASAHACRTGCACGPACDEAPTHIDMGRYVCGECGFQYRAEGPMDECPDCHAVYFVNNPEPYDEATGPMPAPLGARLLASVHQNEYGASIVQLGTDWEVLCRGFWLAPTGWLKRCAKTDHVGTYPTFDAAINALARAEAPPGSIRAAVAAVCARHGHALSDAVREDLILEVTRAARPEVAVSAGGPREKLDNDEGEYGRAPERAEMAWDPEDEDDGDDEE